MRRFGSFRSAPKVTAKVAPQPTSQGLPTVGQTLNVSGLTKTFSHVFTEAPDIWHPTLNPGGKFKSTFINEARTKPEERSLYVDKYVGHDPFGYDATERAAYIEARPLSSDIQAKLTIPFDASVTPIVTGLLSTERCFTQQLGYFGIRAKVAKGATGIWSALWRTGSRWPPEDDMCEVGANDTTKHTFGAHDGDSNADYSVSNYQHIGENGGPFEDKSLDVGLDYHEFGVLRTEQGAAFIRDGKVLRIAPRFTGNFSTIPLWMIASLQVGTTATDSWLGALNTSMSPARLYLREFTAYRL